MDPDPVGGQLDLMTAQILGFDEPAAFLAFEAADRTRFAWTTQPSSHRIRGGQGWADRPLFYAFEIRRSTETVRLAQMLGFPTEREARRWAEERWAQADRPAASWQAPGAQTGASTGRQARLPAKDEVQDAADEERATDEGMPEG